MAQLQYYIDPAEIQRQYLVQNPAFYVGVFGQTGGRTLPFFQGAHIQRGHGIIADIFKDYALPVLHRIAPHVLQGVSRIIGDVRKGRSLRQSVKKRGVSALKKSAKAVLFGKGRKRKVKRKGRKKKRKTGLKKAKRLRLMQIMGKKKKKRTKKSRKRSKKRKTKKTFPLFA